MSAPAATPAGTLPDEAVARAAVPTETEPAQASPAPAAAEPAAAAPGTSSASNDASASQARAAIAADVKSGVEVYDPKGARVGRIESVSATGAVVNTGTARASLPVSSFAKDDKGLVLGMTKSELETAAKKKGPK